MDCRPDKHEPQMLGGRNCIHCGKILKRFRVTRPERYARGSPGAKDPAERNGHYINATDAGDAQKGIRLQRQDPGIAVERLDVQDWSDGETHGKLLPQP